MIFKSQTALAKSILRDEESLQEDSRDQKALREVGFLTGVGNQEMIQV